MILYSVLDLAPIIQGGDAAQAFRNTLDLARHAEEWGYHRYWLAEHHNLPGIASAATCLESIVPSHWQGTVQSDRYRAYAAFVRVQNAQAGCEAITLAGYWAHVRRAIREGQESAQRTVGFFMSVSSFVNGEETAKSISLGMRARPLLHLPNRPGLR